MRFYAAHPLAGSRSDVGWRPQPAQRAEAEATYGTVDGRIDMAPFADLLAVHELGHLFHEQVPFAFPRLWLQELYCDVCVQAYLADRQPQQLPLWTLLPDMWPYV